MLLLKGELGQHPVKVSGQEAVNGRRSVLRQEHNRVQDAVVVPVAFMVGAMQDLERTKKWQMVQRNFSGPKI